MNKWKHIPILAILLAGSLALNMYFLFVKPNAALPTVQTVLDGDTFILDTGERIRLLGVDAPEKDRCYGTEASEALTQRILGKRVRITEGKTDSYGRRMGLVYVGKTLVNTELIRNGYAKPDYTKNSQKDAFIDAYETAKAAQIGLHAQCKEKSTAPPNPDCVIKGNIDAAIAKKFYHLPTCSHYNQIVLDLSTKEQYFCTEEEAIKAGFTKAAGCP